MYYKDAQTGQIFRVNGNTNKIEVVSQSSIPAGTPLSQGQTMSSVAKAYGADLPGASTTPPAKATSTTPPATTTTSSGSPTISGVTKQLDPGMTDPQVIALQKFLNANGFPVASSGPGAPGSETSYFGPATQAALQKYQTSKGIVSSGDPTSTGYGRVGPQTLASFTSNTKTDGTSSTTGNTTVGNLPSTGDASLDQIVKSLVGNMDALSKGYQIPATLQITPDLVSKFLAFAHQVVDPQTKQLIQSKITDINADLANQANQFGFSRDNIVQNFGTTLANEEETAGGAGTAFSGQRGINEGNLVAGTNRSLASLGSTTGYNIGSALRAGAADVGSSNAGGFNLPTIAGGSVSTAGGSRGTFNNGGNISYNYDPNLYTAGVIPSNQNTALNNLEGNYLTQYGNLASSNSNGSRSIKDLLGMMSGLPANASLS